MGPNGDLMGTQKLKKGPHGDRVPQMGTHVGAVGIHNFEISLLPALLGVS